jgi:hypothetical protein
MRHCPALITVLVLAMFLSLALPACTQSGTTQSGQSAGTPNGQANPPGIASPPIQILVTGCLKRGNEGGYYLTDHNGNTWELSSKTVNLAEQVMHAVSITGKPLTLSQEAGNPPGKQAGSGGKPSHGLQVLTLKMLSNSCTR